MNPELTKKDNGRQRCKSSCTLPVPELTLSKHGSHHGREACTFKPMSNLMSYHYASRLFGFRYRWTTFEKSAVIIKILLGLLPMYSLTIRLHWTSFNFQHLEYCLTFQHTAVEEVWSIILLIQYTQDDDWRPFESRSFQWFVLWTVKPWHHLLYLINQACPVLKPGLFTIHSCWISFQHVKCGSIL